MSRAVLSVFGLEARKIGGIEMFARALSGELGEAGWESVLCFQAPPPARVCRYLERDNVAIEVLRDPLAVSWRVVTDMAALLRKHRPEVLHLHFTGFLSVYPWLAHLHGARRVYFTDHGSRPEGYAPRLASPWKRLTARAINHHLSRVIPVSDYNAECMIASGLMAPDRVARIYNGVDLTRPIGSGSAFRERYSIPADRLVVLQACWMSPEKGVGDLVEAARLVLPRRPDAHFVLVGDGPFQQAYREQANDAGIADHFTWTGLADDPMGEGAFAAADSVCQVSRWQEAFGLTIIEGMACRKPVVATRVGGIPEVVADGETGFLAGARQPGDIAEKLLRLLENADLRQRMGMRARQAVEARFHLERNVAELVKLYGILAPARVAT